MILLNQLLPVLFLNLVSIGLVIIALRSYLTFEFVSLRKFVFVAVVYTIVNLQLFMFQVIGGTEFELLRSIVSRIAVIITVLSLFVMFEGLQTIAGFNTHFLDYITAFGLVITTGMLIPELTFMWDPSGWELRILSYPTLISFLGFFFIFLGRIYFTIFRLYQQRSDKNGEQTLLGFGIMSSMVGFLLIPGELLITQSDINYSLTLSFTGLALVLFVFLTNPLIYVFDELGLQYILISNRKDGDPVFYYRSNSHRYHHTPSLYSGWLRGIVNVLDEITNEQSMKSIEFQNLAMITYQNQSYAAYLFSSRKSEILKDLLRYITDYFDTSTQDTDNILKMEEPGKLLNMITHQVIF